MEQAIKAAESDALKRALMTFGNAFGLCLYDKQQRDVAPLANGANGRLPLISHSPVVWLEPVFGVQGSGYFLGTTETIFGSRILLGYWSPRLGILGALGSIVTFIGTTSIIPFLPNAWAKEAGGFPSMTLSTGFLMKDVLFLVASFYCSNWT